MVKENKKREVRTADWQRPCMTIAESYVRIIREFNKILEAYAFIEKEGLCTDMTPEQRKAVKDLPKLVNLRGAEGMYGIIDVLRVPLVVERNATAGRQEAFRQLVQEAERLQREGGVTWDS